MAGWMGISVWEIGTGWKSHGLGWRVGFMVGAMTTALAQLCFWWPMHNRVRRQRDQWIENAFIARQFLDHLHRVITGENGDDGGKLH